MPPMIMNVRYMPTFSPTAVFGLNEPSSAMISPQNPARPGRPSEAIATNAKMPAILGINSLMPPPISAISRVW